MLLNVCNNFHAHVGRHVGAVKRVAGVACEVTRLCPQPVSHHLARRGVSSRATPEQGDSIIYNKPALYDEAFSFREFNDEVKFLKKVYQKLTSRAPLRKAIEFGCGPARHAIGLAAAGVKDVTAIDLNPEMLSYATKLAEAASVNITPVQGDMSNIHFKEPGTADLALCLLGTFSHMTDNSAALAALTCIAECLRPGGLFVLELAHPGDLFDGTIMIGDGGRDVWEVPRPDGSKLFVEWGADADELDPVSQVLRRSVTLSVVHGDSSEVLVEEVVPYRQFTVQEVELMGRMTGLKIVAMYGEMNMDVDLYHEDAYRMVMCLQKQ